MTTSLILGAIVGLILGLLGGGGSVLAVPFLTYGLGLAPKPAVATSLWVVGAAALLAAVVHGRAGHVCARIALVFGLLGAAGAAAGSQLARQLPGSLQLALFAGVMLVAGVRMIRSPGGRNPGGQGGEDEEQAADQASQPSALTPRVALAALVTGVVTGVVGVGGGFLIVPALVFLIGLPMRKAVGTSLAVIVLNALGGSLGYLAYVDVELGTTLPFVVAAAAGGVLGGLAGQRVSPRKLRLAFGVGIVLIAVAMGGRETWRLLG
ncbi:MAG: sulfite exporter TauE/SafE family protein [Planctomycetota bacterium]